MKLSLLQLKKLILRVWFVSVGKLSKSGPATHRLIHLPWGAPGNPRPLLPSTVTLPFAFPPTIFKAGEQNGAEFLSPKLPAHEERPWGSHGKMSLQRKLHTRNRRFLPPYQPWGPPQDELYGNMNFGYQLSI